MDENLDAPGEPGQGAPGRPPAPWPQQEQPGDTQPGYGQPGYGQPGYGPTDQGPADDGQPGHGQAGPAWIPGRVAPGTSTGPGWGRDWPSPVYPPAATTGGQWGWGAPPPPDSGWSTPQRRGGGGIVFTTLLVVVAVIAGIFIGRALPHSSSSRSANPGSGSNSFGGGNGSATTTPTTPGGSGPADVAAIAAKVDPDLVDIDTELGYQDLAAAGTGIVLSSGGLILTNNHVINGSTQIRATDIGNKHVYTATVVGYDETSDVAVIQLTGASGLATADIGDSTSASVGEKVVAIGNAGGVGGTPHAAGGSITALDQSITASDSGDGTSEKLQGLIQTDAAIQPGDSGGSLVNAAGAVIGVDTAASAGFSFNGAGATEGFAIPINAAVALGHQIVDRQGSATVHIGATAFLGVSFAAQSTGGLSDTVFEVIPDTAAEAAGLTAGAVITSFGGTAIKSPGDLTKALVTRHPGDRVVVDWTTAQGATRQADVTLTAGPNA